MFYRIVDILVYIYLLLESLTIVVFLKINKVYLLRILYRSKILLIGITRIKV